jgi:glycosyltransferase involved in cell wall biosynthesis
MRRMLDSPDDGVRALACPAFDAMFEPPLRRDVESAWYGHVPFASWIIPACRPRVLVELGTHAGVSYSAFCEAVLRHRLATRCFAVDTWQGDTHAGQYDESVYNDFAQFHDRHFREFSTMLRMTFDEASRQMVPGSIDLLHIDGLHSYDAVRHDFDTWKPLLSDRAVVMFHDTCAHGRGFGVWQLWQELRGKHPSFEFLHHHGLGVLAVGSNVPLPIAALCALSDDAVTATIRHRFATLGERWHAEAVLALKAPYVRWLETASREEAARAKSLTIDLRKARARLTVAEADANELRQAVADLTYERDRVLNSTLWRTMRPLRVMGERVPRPIRRALRAGVFSLRSLRHRAVPPSSVVSPSAVPTPSPPAAVAGGRIVFISGEEETPGHVYRVVRGVEAARQAGLEASWMSVADAGTRMDDIAAASVVVIWRTTWSDTVARIVEMVRARGAKLVFDVDDLMFRPELATVEVIDGIRSQGFTEDGVAAHFDSALQVLSAADACCCPTTELARHIREYQKAAFVLPNGFDTAAHAVARLAVRRRAAAVADGLVRIGYAAGSRTHQRDFAQAAGAVARVLRERPECRLVLFEDADYMRRLLDIEEFSAIEARAHQIEWRPLVTLDRLPDELARFDINIAPLEVGNPFCEAKSELKYFEAALVDVPTVASPTGPMRRAIRDGETGLLAESSGDWYRALIALVDDVALRRRVAHAAYLDVLWPYGPERRAERMLGMLRQVQGGADGTGAFALELAREAAPSRVPPAMADSDIVFAADLLGQAEVCVVVPLYNYAAYIVEALDSVAAQTLAALDLVVVDDCSTDESLALARDWAERNQARFNRILLMRNRANAGLARTRNAGFDAAETRFVLPLDADNRLLPDCCARTLDSALAARAAFAYPAIRCFGGDDKVFGIQDFVPTRLAGGNFIDAMALVLKSAWAAVGGYAVIDPPGWEDFDLWCRFAERGLLGVKVPEVLAEYRVHDASMLHTETDLAARKTKVIAELEARHAWLSIPYRDWFVRQAD